MCKPLSSIALRCFKYIGHTWPSNRPGGSGTVYCLVLKIMTLLKNLHLQLQDYGGETTELNDYKRVNVMM